MSIVITPQYSYGLALHYLREMLANSVVWRAIVRQPDASHEQFKTLVAANTSLEPLAKERIVYGGLSEQQANPDSKDYVQPPRCIIRHLDDMELERAATTGFVSTGVLLATFELPVPKTYKDDFPAMYMMGAEQIGGVRANLASMIRTAGNLDIERLSVPVFGLMEPDENGGLWHSVGEFLVGYRGSIG